MGPIAALWVRLGHRHGRVQVVGAGLEGGLQQVGLNSGAQRLQMMSTSVPWPGRRPGRVAGVDLLGREARVVELGAGGLGLGEVVVGQDHLLEPAALRVAAMRDCAMDSPTPPVPTIRAFMPSLLLTDGRLRVGRPSGAADQLCGTSPSTGFANDGYCISFRAKCHRQLDYH